MGYKLHIYTLLFILIISGCDRKEYITEAFETPYMEIVHIEKLPDATCEITLDVHLGNGAVIKNAYLVLQDITFEDTPPTRYAISLREEKEFTTKVTIKVPEDRHDYRIKGYLESEKNVYISAPEIVRFSQGVILNGIKGIVLELGGVIDLLYIDEVNKIGRIAKPGRSIPFGIHYSKYPYHSKKFEAKLNGSIPMEIVLHPGEKTENASLTVISHIPVDVTPGIYTLHAYIDDVEYIAEYKIRIIEERSRIIDLDDIPFVSSPSICFVEGDKAYYVHDKLDDVVILSYDFQTNVWENFSARPVPQPYGVGVMPNTISTKTNHYALLSIYDPYSSSWESQIHISIYAFHTDEKKWHKITDYPDGRVDRLISFTIDNKIYMGGGVRHDEKYENAEHLKDFWEYDIDQDTWTKKKDIPDELSYYFTEQSTCGNSKGYLFTVFRDLWQYSPTDDSWIKLNTLKTGPYRRDNSRLLCDDKKIYLTGGYHNTTGMNTRANDTWEYDIDTGVWTMIDMQEMYLGNDDAVACIYKDKLINGYSWRYGSYYSPPVFVEIKIR
ncbi:hypothetical protein LJC54_07900 [Parabacteroides sp. OttesenSCG-928-J18]|nr:hypothetical protein [Parabacteroides sp. OttesenSCG-928-J18]